MSRLVLEIARWEFRRWFKWKSTLITLALALVAGLLFSLASRFFGDSGPDDGPGTSASVWPIPVAHPDLMGVHEQERGLVRLMPVPGDDPSRLLQSMADGELSALLLLHSEVEAELLVSPRLPDFPHTHQLLAMLQAMRSEQAMLQAMEQAGVDPSSRTELSTEIQLQQRRAELNLDLDEEAGDGGPDTLTALVVNVLMLLGVYVGLSLQFYAITGEKQQRVTEQVLACVGPQTWMDGKILGLSVLSMVTTLTYALGFLLFAGIASTLGAWDQLPAWTVDLGLLATLGGLCLGGFLLWVTFFAGIAATVNDPNTSAKGGLMVLPMVPFLLALVAFGNPDSTWLRILSWFPLTAPPLMTTRLLLGEVPTWEVALVLGGLAGGVLLLRRAAGRIFGLAILLQGSEPGWRDILRWLRHP